MKYQFCIRFDKIDVNSSASKAVLDCNAIFSANGYQDYTFTVDDNSNRKTYYPRLLREISKFYFGVKRGAIVGIQYPLLSVNRIFKYFIWLARLKKVKFFCIIHDIESLRTGGTDQQKIKEEIDNLNHYDLLIVHNQSMLEWLKLNGVIVQMEVLTLFDYLADRSKSTKEQNRNIIYAGNLAKSTFIYDIPVMDQHFTVYGPNCALEKLPEHIKWGGVFSPNQIVNEMSGGFGLVWDGSRIDKCDDILGNYLRFNNPHKASLYFAAGLPIIVPSSSALADFVEERKVGFLIDSITDLQNFVVSDADYAIVKANVLKLREKIIDGAFFTEALDVAERKLTA